MSKWSVNYVNKLIWIIITEINKFNLIWDKCRNNKLINIQIKIINTYIYIYKNKTVKIN